MSGLLRARWAAIGAAVAVSLGAGGIALVNASGSPSSTFVAVTPERVLDTRTGIGLAGPFESMIPRDLPVTGVVPTTAGDRSVVPAGATAVTLNVTGVSASAAGFISVRPGDASGPPSTSNLNIEAGQIVPNAVTVQVPTSGSAAGTIQIVFDAYGAPGHTTDILIDVVGYFVAGGGGSGAAGPPGPPGPAGPTGPAGPGLPANGETCTAAGLPGTIVRGHDADGVVVANCFRGLVTTLAGGGTGSDDGAGGTARFDRPGGMAIDVAGNLHVADRNNNLIRTITPAGVVTRQIAVGLDEPSGVAVDRQGNIYIADTRNHRIVRITPSLSVATFAGSVTGTPGIVDGTGTAARFNSPHGVAVDADGNVYVADTSNHRIRRITPSGVVTTLAGSIDGYNDATGLDARFSFPYDVAVDTAGNVLVADAGNHRIRRITPSRVVTTVAGSTSGFANGTGAAARFNFPRGVAVHPDGTIIVGDSFNNRVRRVTSTGVVTTIAGSTFGFANGVGAAARFESPWGVAVDPAGNIYVSDALNNQIRKIS